MLSCKIIMRMKNKEKQTNKIHRVGDVAPRWTVCLTCERTQTSALKGGGGVVFIFVIFGITISVMPAWQKVEQVHLRPL